VQYSCKKKLRADRHAEVHVSSDEESEAETEDGSEDEFVTERKEAAPKWEVLWQRTRLCGYSFVSNWGWKPLLWVGLGWSC
jgi:hypothetical protein